MNIFEADNGNELRNATSSGQFVGPEGIPMGEMQCEDFCDLAGSCGRDQRCCLDAMTVAVAWDETGGRRRLFLDWFVIPFLAQSGSGSPSPRR